MNRIISIASLLMSLPTLAFAQSAADLKNAANTPDKVLTYGMSYSQQRFSTLTQISRGTVKRLVPTWAYSLDDSNKEESQALVMDGVIYITAHDKTAAINVETGREIWKTMIGRFELCRLEPAFMGDAVVFSAAGNPEMLACEVAAQCR